MSALEERRETCKVFSQRQVTGSFWGRPYVSHGVSSLSEKRSDDLLSGLSQDLERLQEYERLVTRQEKLIEGGEFERLARVLDKKAEVLSEIQILQNGAAKAAGGGKQKGGDNADELLARFTTKIGKLAKREKASLRKALIGRAELAGQLQAIHHGKKLLRGYKPERSDGKARFKDIKT